MRWREEHYPTPEKRRMTRRLRRTLKIRPQPLFLRLPRSRTSLTILTQVNERIDPGQGHEGQPISFSFICRLN